MATHRPVSLSARKLSVDRSGHRVLNDVDLTIVHGARMAVVGPNGVGKSTLLATLAGRLEPVAGAVTRQPRSARIGYLQQEIERSPTTTARDLVAQRAGIADAQAEFEAATNELADGTPGAADHYDQALTAWEAAGGFTFEHRVDEAALELGLPLSAMEQATQTLSGGQLTKVGLLSILVSQFDVTLLDEPTNNLDRHGLGLLLGWVQAQESSVVIVSHDRHFLEQTVTSVARVDEQHGSVEVYTGSWQDYETQIERERQRAEARYQAYRDEHQRLAQLAQQKREWADRGTSRAKKRPADNDRNRRSYELASAERQIGAAAKVNKKRDQLEHVERPWQPWELHFSIAESERGSSEVVVADQLVIRRGDFSLGPLSMTINWGDRVLLVGPNGSGKTTLIEGLLGRLPPSGGTVKTGPSIVAGTIGQLRTKFDGPNALLDLFVDESGLDPTAARSLLAKFGIDADMTGRPTATLSPGQRTRAELAVFQATGVNFLVLDEPTNHLDLPAIEQLEQALSDFGGTLLLITHDQRFRDAVSVSHVVEMEELVGGQQGSV